MGKKKTRKKQYIKKKTHLKPKRKSNNVTFGGYFIAVIDVLGQKDRLADFQWPPEPGQDNSEFIEIAKGTFGAIQGLRKTFKQYYEAHCDEKRPITAPMTPEQEKRLREVQRCYISFQGFSDMFITGVSLKNTSGAMSGIYAALTACCVVMIQSLASGHSIRGGLEIGMAAEMEEGDLYGPALNEAYCLESEIAEWPRIVVGKQLVQYLNDAQHWEGEDWEANYIRGMASLCLPMISQDSDNHYHLDYLGEGLKRIMEQETDFLISLLPRIEEHLNRQLEYWLKENRPDLMNRYEQTISYFESRKPIWQAVDLQN